MNVLAFTRLDKAHMHACKEHFLLLVFLPLACFWVVSKWRKAITRTHERDTEKNCPSFPLFQLRHSVLLSQQESKDCRCENRQRSFTITNLFQRRKQSYTRIDLCKRCLTLVSVCSEMGKKGENCWICTVKLKFLINGLNNWQISNMSNTLACSILDSQKIVRETIW